ncbi:hypothetical protein BDFB_011748, partial [Asbolus verrucosus]
TSADVKICKSGIQCLPSDEFENENTTTSEWDNFMEELEISTFFPYAYNCSSNASQSVVLDSDFIWDLRFVTYNERLNKEEKTLNDCYCEHTDCKSAEFRECMASARRAMTEEITFTLWMPKIVSELMRLAQEC